MSTLLADNAGYEDMVFNIPKKTNTNRLVRCELQSDPLWAKMSSAGANNKKRKKPDSKPQSQLAKSLNEKRRREQENFYIEDLADLISASFADMSSLAVKPDKCAILQETVNQIRTIIREQEAAAPIDAVQQGEVSSSKPTILTNEVFGPLLLEALEGFLFVVNSEGKVEFVTDNVSTFIRYTKEEVLGKSVYNIIHHGDHTRFSSCLLPSWSSIESGGQSAGGGSSGSGGGSSSGTTGSNPPKNRTFNCRFLVKPLENPDQTIEEKQQRISKYENMQVVQISSTQLSQWSVGGGGSDKDDEGNDSGPCLFVVRRPMPNEKHAGTPIEQFTMKVDPQGKVLAIDTTGVSNTYLHYLNKDLIGRSLEDLVHSGDLNKVASHIKDTINLGQATSSVYRIRLMAPNSLQDKYIHVQTKSKYFKTPNVQEPEFIMATHSIIGDNELALTITDSNTPASLGSSSSNQLTAGNDSLMASVNGAQPSVSSRGPGASSSSSSANATASTQSNPATTSDLANTITLSNSNAFQSVTLNTTDLDFGFDMFPSSTWGEVTEERPPWERSESRASLTPAPSPLAPAPTTPFGHSAAFPFSPPLLDDKESGGGEDSANNTAHGGHTSNQSGSTMSGPSGGSSGAGDGGGAGGSNPCRLRNLLMTKRESTDSESGPGSVGTADVAAARNRNRILKTLLNQDEDEMPSSAPDHSPHQAKPPSNIMLLKLLNEKSDDDDVETRAGLKKQNELLQQLLKDDEANQDSGVNDDPLLKSLGFRSVSASPAESIGRGRKRPSSEDAPGSAGSQQQQQQQQQQHQQQQQQQQLQQPLTPQQHPCDDTGGPTSGPKRPSLLDSVPPSSAFVTSTGSSKLWEKNKMLASLLAKRPSTPATIPPIPASVISATPQDKLPRLVKHPPPAWSGGSMQQQAQHQQQAQVQQHQQGGSGIPPQSPGGQNQRQTVQQAGQSSSLASPDYRWGDESSSDPYLSHILDQVIEIVPDAVTDSPALMSVINSIESPSGGGIGGSPFQQDLISEKINEKMAISAIQKSLMQCETAVKPISFNTSQLSGNQGGQQQFPPPPVYPQRQRLPLTAQLRQAQYNLANQQQQQQLILQHRNKLVQQQQKQRLLQMQQQQQLLIPSNAAASSSDPGIHNIDSLMNNTVAPNVSLQRSSSVPDSQLSPVNTYAGNSGAPQGNPMMGSSGSQISPGQRQPYSPQPFSPVNGGINSFQGTGSGGGGSQQGGGQGQQASRLSPSSMQNFQQTQLSPRMSQGQQGYGTSQTQSTSWSQQQANRISIQQQQNPMLNAQLTGGNYNTGAGRTFNAGTPPSSIVSGSTTGGVVTVSSATGTVVTGSGGGNRGGTGNNVGGLPSVRSLPSPGPRQSPYGSNADGSGNGPPHGSGGGGSAGPGGGVGPPGSSAGGGSAASYQQQFRIQRSISAGAQPSHASSGVIPQATTHVPGGPPGGRLGSYKDQMQGYQVHQHHHHQHHQHHGVPHPHYSHIPPPHTPHHAMYHHPSPPPPHPSPQQPGSGGSPSSPYTDGYRPHPTGGNNGMTEYVKHELRAMVGARTGGGGGAGMRGGVAGVSASQQQVSLASHSLDTLGISFELQSQGVGDSPKNMWSNMADMGSGSPQPASIGSRSTLEDVSRSNDQKSSLLQKLLSE